jgi:peroxiredoxin
MRKLLFVLVLTAAVWAQGAKAGDSAPEFSLLDSNGKKVMLSDFSGKNVVLEWVNFECPFVEKFYLSQKIFKIEKAYMPKGLIWLSVCSSLPGREGSYPAEELKEKLRGMEGYQTAYLIDDGGKVMSLYGITVTPEVVVVDSSGKIYYKGAIDDRPSTIPNSTRYAKNFLMEVLDSLFAGKPAPYGFQEPYGCGIKR